MCTVQHGGLLIAWAWTIGFSVAFTIVATASVVVSQPGSVSPVDHLFSYLVSTKRCVNVRRFYKRLEAYSVYDYFAPGQCAKYCDQRVCVSVYISVQSRISKLHEFLYRGTVFFSDDNATCYVLSA